MELRKAIIVLGSMGCTALASCGVEWYFFANPSQASVGNFAIRKFEECSDDAQGGAIATTPVVASVPEEISPSPLAQIASASAGRKISSIEEEPETEPTSMPDPEPVLPEAMAAPAEDEPELLMNLKAGYGGRYVSMKQTGGFGSMEGSTTTLNSLSFLLELAYELYRLSIGYESASIDFPIDTVNTNLTLEKKIQSIFVKAGYGIFFFGMKSSKAPLMRASGTTLTWTDVNTISALAGLKLEKKFTTSRGKFFLLGLEVEGEFPLSAGGADGTSLSAQSGWGALLQGYVEKTISQREGCVVSLGLNAGASYERLNLSGTWGDSSNGAQRTMLGYGSKIYLGVKF